jgi:DMSO/TMAO reductase YedYZ molybdopterin-dependent catalytic subunit
VPDHDGTLEIAGAVENPLTLTVGYLRALPPVERIVTLECAGNGRLAMRPLPAGEPWGDYAVSTARWKGALLHEILKRAKPHPTGVEVRFAGADHGSYILNPVLKNIDASDLSFERSLTLVHAADPAAEILIAYEMNGEPLSPDHGSPYRLIVPHWGPYQWQSWSFEWQPTERGRKTLRARATDAAGNVQPEVPIWNRLGYGNNAIEVVFVDVR